MPYVVKLVVGHTVFPLFNGIQMSLQIEINVDKSAEHLLESAGPTKKEVIQYMTNRSPIFLSHDPLQRGTEAPKMTGRREPHR